jgi:hypothetical protein
MDATIFTTEKIAKLLKLPEWRVVRFAQIRGYGITPAWGDATGPGSRRLYNLENVCEIALASWLVQAGLRVAVIGRVLKQLRKQGGLRHLLKQPWDKAVSTYLGIVRVPKGKSARQEAVYVQNWEHLENIVREAPYTGVLVFPIGLSFQQLNTHLNIDKGE